MANKTTAQPNMDVYLVNYKLKTFFLSMANSYCSIPVHSFYFACGGADLHRKLCAIAFVVSLVGCQVKLFGRKILKRFKLQVGIM